MNKMKTLFPGIVLCLFIALPAQWLGQMFPVVGSPVIAILLGIVVALFLPQSKAYDPGIAFASKKILQYAVILLGFGLNLNVVIKTGITSLPIILATIATSLVTAYVLHKLLKIPASISTLVGVGSSICGGSAIAATAPVIDANQEDVAQAISVIFFFNVLAALFFPTLGTWLGFSQASGDAFGLFAGTAINDTSSVTAAASTWDQLYGLGSQTLDTAVTVKLTRTLAIIPITLVLSLIRSRKSGPKTPFKTSFPTFILYFILASLATTVFTALGGAAALFVPFKTLSKLFITLAMAAIGLKTNVITLIRTSGKPLFMGFCCWIGITAGSLALQHAMAIW